MTYTNVVTSASYLQTFRSILNRLFAFTLSYEKYKKELNFILQIAINNHNSKNLKWFINETIAIMVIKLGKLVQYKKKLD